MPLTRERKKEIVKGLRDKISRQEVMIFTDFKGMKSKDLSQLRAQLKDAGCSIQVLKKSLFKIALKEEGIDVDLDKMEGQMALVFGFEDKILPAKMVYNFFEKAGSPQILGGFFDNELREKETVIELAKLLSREELLAKFARTLMAPLSNFLNVLGQSTRNLVFVLEAIKDKK